MVDPELRDRLLPARLGPWSAFRDRPFGRSGKSASSWPKSSIMAIDLAM
jgi:hypothetical protein